MVLPYELIEPPSSDRMGRVNVRFPPIANIQYIQAFTGVFVSQA